MSFRVQHIRLREFFPPDDPIAVTIARLCILRQDLLLESEAIRQKSFPLLDLNGEAWRRLYFWRDSFRTLENIRSAIAALSNQKGFRLALSKEPKDVQTGFRKLAGALEKVSKEFLQDLRNELGGHVKQEAVSKALARMDIDQQGLLQVSDGKVAQQQYKFTTELVYQMILSPGTTKDPGKELKRRSRKAAKLMWAILVIDEIFNTYITQSAC